VRVSAGDAGDFTPEHCARYCTVVVLPVTVVGRVTVMLVPLTGLSGVKVAVEPEGSATVYESSFVPYWQT
jgi:hypothetical protein